MLYILLTPGQFPKKEILTQRAVKTHIQKLYKEGKWERRRCVQGCKWIRTTQAWIQRFKEVSQTGYVPGFPLAAAWISRSTSIMICVELSTLTH